MYALNTFCFDMYIVVCLHFWSSIPKPSNNWLLQNSSFHTIHSHVNPFNIPVIEPPRDKTSNVAVRPAKTQISLGIRPVRSESSLSAWRKLGSLATHWVHSEDSDQTGRMPRLNWVFAGRTVILLVLSWGGSIIKSTCYNILYAETWNIV